jgi:hypothetical protein
VIILKGVKMAEEILDSKEKLKPCPFCGGEATHKIGGEIDTPEFTYCLECAIVLPNEIWQSRPIEDELNAKISELES